MKLLDQQDRFVSETVRRAIEANPDAPGLAKKAMDVTMLFLDIEGYTRLSEELSRPALNAIVERYFSLFLGRSARKGETSTRRQETGS